MARGEVLDYIKKRISVEGYNPINKENVTSNRSKIYKDWKLPLFDNEFFNEILI